MTTVGELWLGFSDEEQDRAAAALRGVLHEAGTRLVLAIDREANAGQRPRVEPQPADALFPGRPAPPVCRDCGTTLYIDPIPFRDERTGERYHLGSTCAKLRMRGVMQRAAARHEAMALPIEHHREAS